MRTSFYDRLEVSRLARTSVIKAAWKALCLEYPDTSPVRYKLNEAKDNLVDEDKRREHDASLNPDTGDVVRIGPYRIVDKIGEGGFATTYLAVHELTNKPVCIKHSPNISALDRALMLEEAGAVWDLRHWAIPAVRDVIELEDGTIAIVMSYVPGPNLQQLVKMQGGAIDPEHVCWFTERVLNALRYMHDNGVVHGDVKPANIIIQEGSHQVVLVDFGLALVKPGRNSTNKGYTEKFASPEHLANTPLLPESDLYCLGRTMIFALGGDPVSGDMPASVPMPVRRFFQRLIVRDVLARPNWQKENLLQTISDVRQEAFGRRASNMKPLTPKK